MSHLPTVKARCQVEIRTQMLKKEKEELPGNLDDIEAEAILGGSVAEFQDGSFQVVSMEADAQTTT